jgi:hypothetical protein
LKVHELEIKASLVVVEVVVLVVVTGVVDDVPEVAAVEFPPAREQVPTGTHMQARVPGKVVFWDDLQQDSISLKVCS